MNSMKIFIYYICKVFSYSPFLTVSQDEKFGSLEKNSFSFNKTRKSLLSFKLGEYAIYLITLDAKNVYRCVKILSISEVFTHIMPSTSDVDEAYDKYKSEVKHLSKVEKNVHKETLQYKISDIEKIETQTFNKFLAYLALLVFIIPLFGDVLESLYKFSELYQVIFIILITYQLINIMFFFYTFIKIKTVKKVTFQSIRQSENPENSFILMLYYEWRLQSIHSTKMVAFMKNIEKYITILVITCITFVLIYNVTEFLNTKKLEDDKKTKVIYQYENESIHFCSSLNNQNAMLEDLNFLKERIFIQSGCYNFKPQLINEGE